MTDETNGPGAGAGPAKDAADIFTPAEWGLLDAMDAIVTVLAKGNPGGVLALAEELNRRSAAVNAAPQATVLAHQQRSVTITHLALRCLDLAGRPPPGPAEDKPVVTDIDTSQAKVFMFPRRSRDPDAGGGGNSAA